MTQAHTRLQPVNWQYKQRSTDTDLLTDLSSDSAWTSCAQFPTEIHVELMKAGKIPHPYKGRNEHEIQWVSQQEWLFRSELKVDGKLLNEAEICELEFESLDTFCTVYLDGKEILKADNHFLPRKVTISAADVKGTANLAFRFLPAGKIAKELEAKHGKVRAGSCNLGDPSRVYVRKMQACFRWDWGPEIMTIGIDRPVWLHIAKAKIQDVWIRAEVDAELKPSLEIDLEVAGFRGVGKDAQLQVALIDADGKEIKAEKIAASESLKDVVKWDLAGKVELWWPIREGPQTLYRVEIRLMTEGGDLLDTYKKRIGFRRVELIRQPLDGQPGTSFFFQVNNRRLFMGGSNWIPTDQMLPLIEDQRYVDLLKLAANGGQNMVRCWGGGVYEPEIFFNTADELGLLIWQDFQFACGIYPVFPEFLASVEQEAIANVKRLRDHPSMAIFCGNNEDYQQIRQWNIDETQADPLPAVKIYEGILPKAVESLTRGTIPYWPGSPNKVPESWATDDPTRGDIHQWTVWAGLNLWQDYDKLGGRFVSEFGMPAMPDPRTVDWWLDGDESQRYIHSKLDVQHNKAGSHVKRFAWHMNEMFRLTSDYDKWNYNTQVLQSEALGMAYRSWRREWRGKGKEYCAGALVWQLNDSFPVTSWALVDYFLRPKLGYYAVKRELQPVAVGIFRAVKKNRDNDRPRQFYEFGAFQSREVFLDIWGTNAAPQPIQATLEVSAFDISGNEWRLVLDSTEVTLSANASTEIKTGFPCPQPPAAIASDHTAPSSTVVVHARLVAADGSILARMSDWPQPYRLLDLPDPAIALTVSGDIITISVQKPAKAVTVKLENWQEGDPEVVFSDNGVDVYPGDNVTITAVGLRGRNVFARCLQA